MKECICFLLVHNKLPQVLTTQSNKHLLPHTFSEGHDGSVIPEWSWLRVSQEVAITNSTMDFSHFKAPLRLKDPFPKWLFCMAVGRRPQLLTTWTSAQGCLIILMPWKIISPRVSTRERAVPLSPCPKGHIASFVQYSPCQKGVSQSNTDSGKDSQVQPFEFVDIYSNHHRGESYGKISSLSNLIYNIWNLYPKIITPQKRQMYYSTIKKMEILPYATVWMNFEDIMLSEISQSQMDNQLQYDSTYIRSISRII